MSLETGGTDCDDTSAERHPAGVEVCDGVDDDCDGLIDDADPDVLVLDGFDWWLDADGDSRGNPYTFATSCASTFEPGWVRNALDCNDNDPAIPGPEETCLPGDDDCNGFTGLNDPGLSYPAPQLVGYLDTDLDGFGDPTQTHEWCDFLPFGASANDDDCDDQDALIDDGLKWRFDADGDGFGVGEIWITDVPCVSPAPGWVFWQPLDCDDNNPLILPGRLDLTNGIDDDCDGLVDDPAGVNLLSDWSDESWVQSQLRPWPESLTWLPDLDGDGRDEPITGNPDLGDGSPVDRLVSGAVLPWLSADGLQGLGKGSFADAGDFNGDGHVDVALGLPEADRAATNGGALAFELGPFDLSIARDVDDAPHWIVGSSDNQFLGARFAIGAIDEDGLSDVVVSATGVQPGVWLVVTPLGEELDIGAAAAVVHDSDAEGIGHDVVFAGDLDGDGVAEWGMSATADFGVVYLYSGPVTGIVQTADAPIRIEGPPGVDFGAELIGTDTQADPGKRALFVAAPAAEAESPSVFVFEDVLPGRMDDSDAVATVAGTGTCGVGLGPAVDLDGNTENDFVLPCASGVELFNGPLLGTYTTADAVHLTADTALGNRMARASGDGDGDGFDDLLIAQPSSDTVHMLRFPL